MELERGGLSEGEDCSAPGEDGGFRAYCLGTSSEPWSSGWGVYVCLCDRCIRFPVCAQRAFMSKQEEKVNILIRFRIFYLYHYWHIT